MNARKQHLFVVLALATFTAGGCRRTELDDQDQIGAAAGEVMASFDEAAQGTTATASLPWQSTPECLTGNAWQRAVDWLMPSAHAASCWQSNFSACSAGVRTRSFGSCTVGAATLDGTVTLTFSDTATCRVAAVGDSVNRVGSFTVTGPYGGTLTVTAPGGGQTATRTADGWDFDVLGMQRVLATAAGRKLFDISTRTTQTLKTTGSTRADFKLVSGAMEVSHNIAGYKVTLVPENLAWSAGCNCAVSGELTGSISGGKHDGKSATVTLTGCGTADVTVGSETESVVLDRCAPVS